MSKVIPLKEKLKVTTAQKAAVLRKQKIRAVVKVFHCAHCATKCERCGASLLGTQGEQSVNPRIPYHFCAGCAEEYVDYIQRLQGEGDPEAYWHNHHWLKAWRAWIEYQGAVDQYLRSKEFRRLMDEMGPDDTPCD
ncbi:MAG: hypothetical protein WAU91_15225 [Desulfatitalea sp.]